MTSTTPMRRRDWVRSSATAGGLLILKPETVFGSQANSAISLGIVGCGGRGIYIGAFFQEFTGARVAALHDYFEDRVAEARGKLNAAGARGFTGLNGYQDLIQSGIDAVAIMSPPYFHPEQTAAAVAAGKHVFIAKPVAVDVPGCQSISESARRAQGKLSFLVDFQTRVQAAFMAAAARVHRGDIGSPVLGHVYYHAGRLQPRKVPGDSPAQSRLRNWVFDKVLSGDIIVEQNVHVIDVANWYLEEHPLQASGTGGRKARTDVGDCWDHFLVNYWYPNEVKVDFSSAQFTRNFNQLAIRVYGTRGTVDSHYNGLVRITGENPWEGTQKDDTFRQGAITNVRDFAESIRTRNYLNNAQESVDSNLTAILGRAAAYGERLVTWNGMIQQNEKLEAGLGL